MNASRAAPASPSGSGDGQRPAHAARFGMGLLSLFTTTVVLALMAWAVVPDMLLGWQSSVVASGSMSPRINEGDIVVVRPLDSDAFQPGDVVLFDTEAGPTVHRLVERSGHFFTTKGDANTAHDARPVHVDSVRGRGVYLVPWIGLPLRWRDEGRWVPVGAFIVAIAAAALTCRWAYDTPDPWARARPPYRVEDGPSRKTPQRGLLPDHLRHRILTAAHDDNPLPQRPRLAGRAPWPVLGAAERTPW